MKMNFNFEFNIDLENANIKNIMTAFSKIIPLILTDFTNKVLLGFAMHYMELKEKPFRCECGNCSDFSWKTQHGKKTKISTIFQEIILNQLQVLCKKCGKRIFITRQLLGIEPRIRIPEITQKILGLIGSLTTFRISSKIISFFGYKINKMAIWRSVQAIGRKIKFDLDENELAHGEADGTGIPINGIEKRGKEMKVFIQHKQDGKVRIAGLAIGEYDKGWDKLFKPLKKKIKKFGNFLLVTDGDTSILKGLGKKVKIIFQRCLWHIPHQTKYVMWKDKVKNKSDEWLHVMGEIINICGVKRLTDEVDEIKSVIKSKNEQLQKLIDYCVLKGYEHSATYLLNASPDMFTAFENKLNGKTTSRVERVMKTINARVNVGKWSSDGVLNANKIRLAYYYNGFDVE
jgi:hypothetical protein